MISALRSTQSDMKNGGGVKGKWKRREEKKNTTYNMNRIPAERIPLPDTFPTRF